MNTFKYWKGVWMKTVQKYNPFPFAASPSEYEVKCWVMLSNGWQIIIKNQYIYLSSVFLCFSEYSALNQILKKE